VAIDEILGNEVRASELVKAGRRRAEARTWDAVAARIVDVLASVS
jgi:glycosyltransferase involved in cell wall biosynthesis